MACPYGQGNATHEMDRVTALGYRLFRCRPCRRTFNERTGTPFNHLQVPTDIALLVVLWRLRYKLSLRDLAEMVLTRGFTFTHETVREWEERFAPLLTERLRAKRQGKAGKKWHADETYVKVDGRWRYLYRAIDADGNLVDSMLSETRDMEAAKRFFARARTVVGQVPEKVTTDGHDAYPRAIRETRGPDVRHRPSRYMNNRMEDGYNVVKRLLGLAYFWVGSTNGVQLQLWATWLFYAVLVDLTDAVAQELDQPFAALSLEMVYRSLYFFTGAYQRGEATDVVAYLAAEAVDLGIVKRKRKRDLYLCTFETR